MPPRSATSAATKQTPGPGANSIDSCASPHSASSAVSIFRRVAQTVEWRLHLGDFPTLLTEPLAQTLPKPHVIMFDAFSPAKNPAMWTLPLFTNLFQLLDPQRPCALPTYSRSTMLRVTLLLAGFFVGVGHATGEKEETTIAANTLDLINEPLNPQMAATRPQIHKRRTVVATGL